MGDLVYQWIDLIWLPVGWFAVHRQHRLKTVLFIAACVLTLRTQVELMDSIGFDTGFLPLLKTPLYTRGLVVYSVVIALFLVLAHYSRATQKIVFFAATLTVYFFAFCISMLAMAL